MRCPGVLDLLDAAGLAEIFEAAGRRSFAPFAVRDHHRAG
jgi:hypothetical protein